MAKRYDRRWSKLRDAHMMANPYCVFCKQKNKIKRAAVVDHIVRIEIDPTRRLDPSNLQSLCTECHSGTKQSMERGAPTIGPDGWAIDMNAHTAPGNPQYPAPPATLDRLAIRQGKSMGATLGPSRHRP